jgi:hypothetical protein
LSFKKQGKLHLAVESMENENSDISKYLVSKPEWLFTENETNSQKLYNVPNYTPYVKDAFHSYVVNGNKEAVNPKRKGM